MKASSEFNFINGVLGSTDLKRTVVEQWTQSKDAPAVQLLKLNGRYGWMFLLPTEKSMSWVSLNSVRHEEWQNNCWVGLEKSTDG